ncbi:MAG: polyribonucleotide nucleotidyltransferase [Alphaproteobacteria bacterium]
MVNIVKKEIEWGGRKLSIETGKIARQADGAVMIKYGGTEVLCTVVAQKHIKEDCNFFPLTVNYIEMAFAAGKIPGGFHKREGRLSETETLASRLIDRGLRPLFNENFYNETQVICTVVSHDLENSSEIVAYIGAAAALAISGIPFAGPLAAAKIGLINGEFVLNPTIKQALTSKLDLVLAGTKDSILMVESEAHELSEEQMLEALDFAHKNIQPVIEMIQELAHIINKPIWHMEKPDTLALEELINKFSGSELTEAYSIREKAPRREKIEHVKQQAIQKFVVEEGNNSLIVNNVFKKLEENIVRGNILEKDLRIDGRNTKAIRDIFPEVGILGRTHGSALFTRGETQALATATLGTARDEQLEDLITGDRSSRFMFHYNFPPYSVGEVGQLKAPGRREIGHGRLALRAIQPVLPIGNEFPYTIRVVSNITECNGSSSMASVCGASLALMDAGVPLKAPVAGIAMGLIKEDDKYAILSDIMGDEDNLGDMDFKVAGTQQGITALQMDIKIHGISMDIMESALKQAKEGRIHILSEMSKAINEPRETVNEHAPSITTINIDKNKIREVIGSGGSVIKKICEVSGAKIDIEDNGTIKIAAVNGKSSEIAVKMIEDIVLEPEIGKVYPGKVVKTVDFGAFVNFLGSRDGLIHISELAEGHVEQVTDCIKVGDEVKVVVLGMDKRGKIQLSLRLVDQVTGEILGHGLPENSRNNSEERGKKRPAPSGNKPSFNNDRGSEKNGERVEKRKYYN